MSDSRDNIEALRARALEFGLVFISEIGDESLDPVLVRGIPVEWARTHGLLPVRLDGELCLLVTDPAEVGKHQDIALLVGNELRPVVAPAEVILKAIERCYVSRKESTEDFLRDMDQPVDGGEKAGEARSDDLLKTAEEAPVTQLVNVILLEAVKARASDIHFEPFHSRLRVRYRVDGVLYEQASPPKHLERTLVSRIKVMAHLDISEKRLPQDGMARVRVGEREIDIRVSTVPVAEGERVVLRLLNRDSSVMTLGDLGMPEGMIHSFDALLHEANGLIIVCGPTGSGKTTTLYAAIQKLDTRGRNVMTIEDPIEYQLQDIGQMQVKPKIGLTFARSLRHILRQDPDVVLVGETRDSETAEIAVRASLTGHLVFTTLHTNDAASAVIRMMDMSVEPYLLAAALRGVLAQRLVRQLCPHCRKPVTVSPRELSLLGAAGERLQGATLYAPAGCPQCLGGYRGRIGIFEMLVMNSEIEALIRSGASAARQMRDLPGCETRLTMLDDGLDKVLAGRTSLAEILYALGISGA
ncbi:MAG: ATPase, T2SS/T4P/T4SS family [bacterium]